MQIVARLARSEDSAVLAGGHSGVALEGGREVALITIPGGGRDFDEGSIGGGELLTGPLDAQTSEVVADGAAVVLAEHPRQVGGMHANGPGDVVEREAFSK